MRPILVLVFLALFLSPASASYIFHIPVNVQSSTEPAVLMPGDTGVLTIELQNGAAEYGAGSETLAGTLSTPINGTILRGTNEIAVISPDYKDIGMIGPTDKITLYTPLLNYQNGIVFTSIFREFANEINSVAKKTIGATFFSTLGNVY